MPRFYLDRRDGENFLKDEEGSELASLEAARIEAATALSALARDALPGTVRQDLAIEVSDEKRGPLFTAALWFEDEPTKDE
jgi:hypothetical protein